LSPEESRFKSCVKQKKPFLSKQHRRDGWTLQMHINIWTVDDWKQVLWSDETKINCLGQMVGSGSGEPGEGLVQAGRRTRSLRWFHHDLGLQKGLGMHARLMEDEWDLS